jgi:peptidoglycan/xylan/chitin deacetylase (PgdA/CDA1 family)
MPWRAGSTRCIILAMVGSHPPRTAPVRSVALFVILPAILAGCQVLGLRTTPPGATGGGGGATVPLVPGSTVAQETPRSRPRPSSPSPSPEPVHTGDAGASADPSPIATSPASPAAATSPVGRSVGRAGRRRRITRGVVSSVRTRDKEIAITIDDGGDPAVCSAMADMLIRKRVAATFFPIGRYVERSPRVWARIARHFPIGNHTAFHAVLTRLDDERIRKQILTDERFVRQATGKPPIHVLRPPGGIWDERVQRIAAKLGYRVLLLWDVSDADTAPNSRPQGMLHRALGGGPGSILLMHCNRPVSKWLLPRIIKGYRDRGYRFVTIPEMLAGK